MEKIWYEDLNVIIQRDKLIKYIPLNNYTVNEKLNSMVRLSLYLSLLLIVLFFNINYIFILIVVLIITYLIHISGENKIEKKLVKEVENYKNLIKDKDYKKRNVNVKDHLEKCVLPTDNNPFMNFMIADKRDRKKACKTFDNENLSELVDDKFSKGLYKDINSIYNNENSQREFYTMPNTEAANRQKEFGEWLYKTPKTCKDGNGFQCVGNNMNKLNGESYQFL